MDSRIRWRSSNEQSCETVVDKGEKMTNFTRKLITLLSALVILAAALTVAGCKGKDQAPAQKQPTKQPMEEL